MVPLRAACGSYCRIFCGKQIFISTGEAQATIEGGNEAAVERQSIREREREGQATCGKLNVNLIGALSRPSAYITGQQLIT